ncbi:hypothetical protein R1T08_17770 [Streptomyces sp. SBC-4]|nr:hypothetical protein [Streptomyces sp. SBC-4]MDV5146005.1 hypothetical protein [Streptomyces sp. SBC-4]
MGMAPDEAARKYIAETSGVTDEYLAYFDEQHGFGGDRDDG